MKVVWLFYAQGFKAGLAVKLLAHNHQRLNVCACYPSLTLREHAVPKHLTSPVKWLMWLNIAALERNRVFLVGQASLSRIPCDALYF
jgi:hypothetical protein